jgi:hypothetical protein
MANRIIRTDETRASLAERARRVVCRCRDYRCRESPKAFSNNSGELLPNERGENSEPSITDFLVIEVPVIVERFANGFDGLAEIVDGVPAGRMLIASGLLVSMFVAFDILLVDGSIEVVGLDIDQP